MLARGDAKRLQQFIDNAPKVDANKLKAAATKIVTPEQSTLIAVGDVATFKKDLSDAGSQTTLTVEDLFPGLADAAKSLPH